MPKTIDDYLTPDGAHTGWTGPRTFGRPNTAPRVSNRLAQVIQYERTHGPLKTGMGVHETCDYRYCLTPEHIEAVPLDQAKRAPSRPATSPLAPVGSDTHEILERIEFKLDLLLGILAAGEYVPQTSTPDPEPAEPEVYYFYPDHHYRCEACGEDVVIDEPVTVPAATGTHKACGAAIRHVVETGI